MLHATRRNHGAFEQPLVKLYCHTTQARHQPPASEYLGEAQFISTLDFTKQNWQVTAFSTASSH